VSSIQSVERAFEILRELSGGPSSVSELADRTSLPKSTVSRMLSTLLDLGAVQQDDSGYRVGGLVVDIAAGAARSVGLLDAARPHLTALVATTGETAGLSVLEGEQAVYVDQVAADTMVQVRNWTGERIDAHAVSSGLVLLAARRRRPAGKLRRHTERTTIDHDVLARRLRAVVDDGFAWTIGEYLPDLASVAAPIYDHGVVVAAVHVHGPAYRFPGAASPTTIEASVIEAADRISRRLSDL
jgi:DNA-binding IclR family transcriptional regulator